ncbi:hypothetical protein Ddye_029998 [Dipteronia dyeriana]|uniref:Uncharacterized protein n=1 Tax=Dipteronia dyeriana TaxID=168575 RepID=A0AAD9WL66_9ROSI|nr:hypothetical protein Ddye_032571 [Dipteronia dyeriana]KAK2635206.1 hypothetical protein Ddye_029998 [Dipteronia dyeriana]
MQKRSRVPILQKVYYNNLLKISIFVAKMRRKPIFTKLVLLKIRSRKKLKSKFKLLKHYNNNNNNNNYSSRAESQEFFFLRRCFGGLKSGRRRGGQKEYSLAMERYMHNGVAVGEQGALEPLDLNQDDDDDDDSVDQRAERFIEWFYQEMRLQRRESI